MAATTTALFAHPHPSTLLPPSPSDGIAIMAINYLILLSRQGKVVCCPPSSRAPFRLAAQT